MNSTARLALADPAEAADLGGFLARLLRFDRAAAVRLQAVRSAAQQVGGQQGGEHPGGEQQSSEQTGVLAVFGRLPLGTSGAVAVRTARLTDLAQAADLTVSAGQLLEGVDEATGAVALPAPVTGPAWAGLLPPRTGWRPLGELGADQVMPQLMAAVREFKERSAAVPEQHRSRQVLDALADEIWSRPLLAVPELPLRAAHAAYVIGFLHPGAPLSAHRAGSWLRLNAPNGSVAVRAAAAPGAGLGLTPLL
ncbi:hypothetical protein P3T36_001884 [Kitasatospora sp. MAP12-15]|uniref:hypothetical protein n=1 Tax=unclassified Kitasatospora TaxID=2633591 RepID=UPI00247690C9|nr:hypothetical protein [Kitasatospora sp. MAP12-44]MDH6113231.1 hypothetical protein [Kitasatospora sp. MAP12-44]